MVMSEPSIAAQIADTKARQAELFAQAEARLAEILAEAAELAAVVGARTRDQIPAGLLRRKSRAKPTTKPVRVRKAKSVEVPA
jgi:hypothetical protein